MVALIGRHHPPVPAGRGRGDAEGKRGAVCLWPRRGRRRTFVRRADKRSLTISVDGQTAVVFGVRRLLYEMLYNLCDNAIKYNRRRRAAWTHATSKAARMAPSSDGLRHRHRHPRPSTRAASSSGSTASTRATPRPPAAPGWACPSSSTPCSTTAAASWKASQLTKRTLVADGSRSVSA